MSRARGKKLQPRVRSVVMSAIVAGMSNQEINQMLEKDGEFPLSAQTFWNLRNLPDIMKAVAQQQASAIQSGIARRDIRLQQLDTIAKDLFNRMHGIMPGHPDVPRVTQPLDKYLPALEGYLSVLREVRAIETGASSTRYPQSSPVPVAAADKETARIAGAPERRISDTIYLSMVNDELQAILQEMKLSDTENVIEGELANEQTD